MSTRVIGRRVLWAALALGLAPLPGCGDKQAPPATSASTPAPATTEAVPAAATGAPPAAPAVPGSWTPEALEELLAPIALYPDPVLSQVLIASTNPQEVLDAGNWLLTKEGIKGKALDDAAAQVGFTPPIRALIQFPATVDMMCLEMGWTTELGEAFTADQAGVLDAIQRLRKQAKDVGNLESSEQMLVETEVQEGKEVVVLKPAQPEVVYVPQYDPQTAYAPVPAATAPAAAPAAATPATTTTTTTTTGHSTGSMIATGVLAFGAGILVNELFDDDDDYHHGYYYPNYGYGGMPYYPPYPYRPSYGGGYYPSNGYNRPPNYNSGFQNTGNIIINTGGGNNRPGNTNNYWDRYDGNGRGGVSNTGYNKARTPNSPISAARPDRPELNELNKRQPRAMPADVKRPSADATVSNWKGQSGYAGKKPSGSASASERIANASPAYSRPASNTRQGSAGAPKPKVQGSYAGASSRPRADSGTSRPTAATRDVQKPTPSTRDVSRPASGARDDVQKPGARDVQRPSGGDRGYGGPSQMPQTVDRPDSRPSPSMGGSSQRPTAVSGASRGGNDRAASHRGRQSMPEGARSKGGGGGRQRAGR